ncbi:hypothetical protein H0H87_008333, partial [Tephrocybe sp. NHM501043]
MPPADNNPTAQPTVAPDGKKPSFRKRLVGRFKSTESSSASSALATRSMENSTAADGKPSPFKRLFGALKPTKSGIAPSTLTTRSVENLAVPSVPAVGLAPNVPDAATDPTVLTAAASTQVVTAMDPVSVANDNQGRSTAPAACIAVDHTLAINVDQGRFTTAVAGPTPAMDANERSSTTPVPDVVSQNNPAINTGSLTDIDQTAQPDPNVPQGQNKFKDVASVALDGFLTTLRITKEVSDWNPILKAALNGVVAVVDLAKTVSSNSQDMKDTVDRIQGLLPILETSVIRLEGRKDGFGDKSLMTFTITMQTELTKIQTLQSHSVFRRVLQGAEDADTLVSIYKKISEALEQFK